MWSDKNILSRFLYKNSLNFINENYSKTNITFLKHDYCSTVSSDNKTLFTF